MKPKKTQNKNTQRKKKMFYPPIHDKYIDPFTDFGFKKLFGEECNKDLLLDFLNELLHKEEGRIVNISYLKLERLGISINSRGAVFDIYCENEKGEKFIVELQKEEQEFFKDRTVFYSTFPIVEQAPKGKEWNYKLKEPKWENWNYELKAVYIIAILDFVFDENENDLQKYRYDVKLTDTETHKVFYDKLTFIYLEMPKFTKEVDELETRFDKWLYVIRNLSRLDELPDKLRERIFEKLLAAAEVAKLSFEEYRAYQENIKNCWDMYSVTSTAKKKGEAKGMAKGERKGFAKGKAEGKAEGLAEGKAEGLAEGEEKGRTKERKQIVMNCHQKGFSEEMIAAIAGLTIQEINAILEI